MIESMSNGQLKKIQKLMKQAKTRKQEKAFVVEGWKMVSEALVRNLVLHLYVKESEQHCYEQHLQMLGVNEIDAAVDAAWEEQQCARERHKGFWQL